MPADRLSYRDEGDVVTHRQPAEAGCDADAESGGDQGELGVVVGGDMGDAGLDALGAQGEHQPFVAELAARPGHPLLVGEVLQVDDLAAGQRVVGGKGQVGGVVEEMGPFEPGGDGRPLVVPVEDDRQVAVAAQYFADPGLGFQLGADAPDSTCKRC
ncbi:ABC-type sugar transport system, periplasmic component [Streptomyces laurentii]|uniref:ABC-type sugar transport system, periplasmic component n=1 Tax=Streptomyces laurentii TaxID=39478 RepID=A0A160NV38_STRLU|nr:ABC-type sugar transport system, periplasmic component [Streptomyces laurentii]